MVGSLPSSAASRSHIAVLGSDRADATKVLRHALDEPERRIDVDDRLQPAPGPAPAPDVVLELVHHLVLQHVLQLLVGAGEGQDDPLLAGSR